MPGEVIQYSLSAGEISPRLLMRGDIEAYPNAAQTVENFFVDYRGGAVSRPGTELVGVARGPFRNVPVQLAFIPGGGLVLEVSDKKFRFIQDQTYVTEEAKTVSAVTNSQITVTNHGYTVDDWLLVDGKQVRVRAVIDQNTFELEDIWGNGWVPDVGAIVGRVYELDHPYAEEDIWDLNFTLLENEVIITSGKYAPRKLKFSSLASWSLEEISLSSSAMQTVTGLVASATTAGTAYYVYAVSAVLHDGTETAPCKPVIVSSAQMSTVDNASISLRWDPHPDAKYYIVYRSREFVTVRPSLGEELGYCGKAFGTEFVDRNILPDFTKVPLIPYDPFAGGAIKFIGVTAGGSGYLETSTVSVSSASGSGFSGYPIITKLYNNTTPPRGVVGGIKILNPGKGYTQPVSITVSDGSGASFNVKVSSLTGNWPRCAARFQQRLVFAGTDNQPSTVFGSRPGDYYNFSYTIPSQHDDAYEHTIDTTGVQYIKYLLPTNAGLMLFTDAGVFTMTGDATGRAVTPLRVHVSPQMSLGASDVQPIVVDNDVLFVQAKGIDVRALRYNPVSSSYSAERLTILANHLLETYSIVDWTYAADPFRQILCIREDGQMLCLTYLPGQKIFAWSRFVTDGEYKTVASVKESGVDRVYVGVRRRVNGRWIWFQEVFDLRLWNSPRDAFAVDCGLRRKPATENTFISIEKDGTFNTTASVSVGDLIVADGARIEVISPGVGRILEEPTGRWPIETNNWLVYRGKVFTLTDLDHLEGCEVSILADGNAQTPKTVVNGTINLDVPAWEVSVGLPFVCRLKTMPIDVLKPAVQSKRRRHWKVGILVQASRGLYIGSSWEDLIEVKEAELVYIGQPQKLFTGWRVVHIPGTWRPDAAVHIEVRDPLPAAVLGLSVSVTFGDDDVR